MRVLVLNRFGLSSVRYPHWAPPGTDITMITSADTAADPAADLTGYAHVQPVESYFDNAQVEYHAHVLHRRNAFQQVLAMSEFDLIRAARLRAHWGLPGQSPQSATAFRDKLDMKTRLAAHGIPLAPFRAIDDASQLIAFCRTQGFPVVVKPRRGASSVGVRVIEDEAALTAFLGPGTPLAGDRPADLLAEGFVPGEMFHVDGVVADGDVALCWPSETTPCLQLTEGRPLLSALLEADDPLREPLVRLTTETLRALPTPTVSLFHAEVFRTSDGTLVMNEIGCRVGGGRIRDVLRNAFEVDLIEWYARAAFEGRVPDTPLAQWPLRQAGYAKAPLRAGTVREVPPACPVPGIVLYRPQLTVGQVVGGPESSEDCSAELVAVGPTRALVEKSLGEALAWCRAAVRIEP